MNSKVAVKWLALITSFSTSFTVGAADLTNFPPTTIASGAWGSIAPPALNQLDVSDGNGVLYRTWFNDVGNGGDLLAHSLSSTGSVTASPSWSANSGIPVYTDRKLILGSSGSASNYDCAGTADPLKLYVCGDSGSEAAYGGGYRDRTSKLGAIVHSNPLYIGKPLFNYNFDNYLNFRSSNQSRAGRIYVSGNDGMLHAFDTSGNELFGYIPGMVATSLSGWANGSGSEYLVDGLLSSGDVYANFGGGNEWKTLLVGGLGAGGQGYYILDVTTPAQSTDTAANIANTKQWQLDSTNATGMGYTYGRALLARTNASGKWALIAPNGYISGGKPALYIREIQNPSTVIRDLSDGTDSSNNGLSSPAAIDVDNDYKIDYVYAGDLEGNLYRFNVKDSNPSNWSRSKIFSATDGTNPQPIIAAPELALLSGGKVMVYFGTGDPWGVASESNNSFYALKDDLSNPGAPYDRTDMQLRVMGATSDSNYQTIDTGNTTNYDSGAAVKYNWPTERGWFLDLPSNEHLLQNPVLNDRRIQFMAHNLDTGANWLTQLDYEQGLLPDEIIFDTNGDGILDANDNISGLKAISTKRTADLISGQTLARVGSGKSISYLNSWNKGTAGSGGGGGGSSLSAKSCSKLHFNRFDFDAEMVDEPSNYAIKFTAYLSETETIWIQKSGMDMDKRTTGGTITPPAGSADRGAGEGETAEGYQTWNGLSMYLGSPGSKRVSMDIEYEGPYRIDTFMVEFFNNTSSDPLLLERIHDGISICNCTNNYVGDDGCGSAERQRFDRGDAEGTTSISYGSDAGFILNNDGGFNEGTDLGAEPATPPLAPVPSDGQADEQLQSGDDATTGRLRWRELLF